MYRLDNFFAKHTLRNYLGTSLSLTSPIYDLRTYHRKVGVSLSPILFDCPVVIVLHPDWMIKWDVSFPAIEESHGCKSITFHKQDLSDDGPQSKISQPSLFLFLFLMIFP